MGIFSKTVSAIRKGLTRTREALFGGLTSMLSGKTLSDALIDDVEDYLIKADVGVKATVAIIEQLREACAEGELEKGEDAIDFLKTQLKDRFTEMDRSIATAPRAPTVIWSRA